MYALIKFEDLWTRRISYIQIKGEGKVTGILNDDLAGHKHQRFIVELAPHKTVLILYNIDMFPRLEPLDVGSHVEFFGEYIWNRHGGIVHWTHFDPSGKHDDGYIKVATEGQQAGGGGSSEGVYGGGRDADDRRITDRRITDRRTADRRVGDRRAGDRRSGDRRAMDRRDAESGANAASASAGASTSVSWEASQAGVPAQASAAASRKHTVTPGVYRHFKGDKYEVVGLARHSETRENLVIYKSLTGDGKTWVRPLSMWNDAIYDGDKAVPRFKRVADVSVPRE